MLYHWVAIIFPNYWRYLQLRNEGILSNWIKEVREEAVDYQ
jgi:hypothetical protein